MSKTETAAAAAAAPAPTPVIPVRKPFAISVGAPAQAALAELVALARDGYTISEAPIDFAPNGYLFFQAILGNPLDYHVQKSRESAEIALANEDRERAKAVQEEARRIVEAEKREALAKQVETLKRQQAKAIAELEASTAAAIAAL
jgi:hypothetical protein